VLGLDGHVTREAQEGGKGDGFLDGELGEEVVALEHVGALFAECVVVALLAVDQHGARDGAAAFGRGDAASEQVQERSLPCTTRAHDSHHVAGLGTPTDAANNLLVTNSKAQVLEFESHGLAEARLGHFVVAFLGGVFQQTQRSERVIEIALAGGADGLVTCGGRHAFGKQSVNVQLESLGAGNGFYRRCCGKRLLSVGLRTNRNAVLTHEGGPSGVQIMCNSKLLGLWQ
jgi:hypothetical protein